MPTTPPGFVVVTTPDLIEAWSVKRLPFEPTGSAVAFRNQLRSGVAGLELGDRALRCVYASRDSSHCDIENVLLYNVGMAYFAKALVNGVVFERSFGGSFGHDHEEFAHYHRYEPTAVPEFEVWSGRVEANCVRARIPHKQSDARSWWLTSAQPLGVRDVSVGSGRSFGLSIRLAPGARKIHTLLKPMIDGVVAALHCFPSPSAAVVARLADQLDVAQDRVESLLAARDRPTPLGERRIVHFLGTGLQWDPADHLCFACSVIMDESVDHGYFEVDLTTDLVEAAGQHPSQESSESQGAPIQVQQCGPVFDWISCPGENAEVWELDQFGYSYDAYTRIAASPEDLHSIVRPVVEALDRDEPIPEWAGLDLLRASLFFVHRRGHHSGPSRELESRFRRLIARIRAITEDRPLPRDFPA